MHLTAKELCGIPAITQEGARFGYVESILFDAESHLITHYIIRLSWRYLKKPFGLFQNRLALVAREQVVRITRTEFVVQSMRALTVYDRQRQGLSLKGAVGQPVVMDAE